MRCDLVYLPLPPKTSKLEELLSSLESPLSNKACKLSTAPIPTVETPLCIGLSYVWGDPNDTREIILDGRPVQKTVNLIAALRQLRDLLQNPSQAPGVFSSSDVLFWVDALCIDQSNIEERAAQVPRIASIYGSAELVVAWLGLDDEHTESCAIQRLMNKCQSIDWELNMTQIVQCGSC